MGANPKRVLRGLAVALAALALALVAANWAIERFYPIRTFVYRLDDELLYTTVPGRERVLVMDERVGGASIWIRIGNRGFRGADLEPADGRPRVAVYGDSFVMASNVAASETFVVRLGEHLSDRYGVEVQTVNAGVTGYGPDQACLKLEREVDELAPSLVVFVLCATNDFGDLLRNKLFRIDEEGGFERFHPTFGKAVLDDFAQKEAESRRPALVRLYRQRREVREQRRAREVEHDFLAERGMKKPPYIRWYLEGARQEFEEVAVRHDPNVVSLWQDYYDADVAIYPDSPSARYKRLLMQGVLTRLRDACAARDLPLVVVVAPSAVDLVDDFEIHVRPDMWTSYDPERLTSLLVELLEGLGVPRVDLYGPFRDSDPGTLFVGGDDFHWNALGQDLGARLVAEFVHEHGLLPVRR